jgi:hypothetical protein
MHFYRPVGLCRETAEVYSLQGRKCILSPIAMTNPHAIHLGAAWVCLPQPAAGPAFPAGQVVWVRRFGRPAGLARTDRLQLAFERPAASARAELLLNGLPLPSLEASDWEQDVTRLIAARNELRLMPRLSTGPSENVVGAMRQPLPECWGRVLLRIVSD